MKQQPRQLCKRRMAADTHVAFLILNEMHRILYRMYSSITGICLTIKSEYDVVCMRRYTERNKRLACQSANRIVSKV